jgi:hypothetical protein
MEQMNKVRSQKPFKGIFVGYPNSGKSTAALLLYSLLSRNDQHPCWIFQYDICDPLFNVPGVDYDRVFRETYPPADIAMDKDEYDLPRNVGDKIITDILELKAALLQKKAHKSGAPLPGTIILEGWVNALRHLHNRKMRIDGKKGEDDYVSTFTPFRNRLNNATNFWDMVVPLPVNVIITTWASEETKQVKNDKGKMDSVKTGVIQPELGGQFDIYGPGKADACLYFYADQGKHFMRTRSNAMFKGFGFKDQFGLPEVLNMTLTPGVNPWAQVFKEGQ